MNQGARTSFRLLRTRRASLDSASSHFKARNLSNQDNSSAATSMMDAFAGLRMPPSHYDEEKPVDDQSCSSGSACHADPKAALPIRRASLCHSKPNHAMPIRRPPGRSSSSALEEMAQKAFERQALPKERGQENRSLRAMNQSLHRNSAHMATSTSLTPLASLQRRGLRRERSSPQEISSASPPLRRGSLSRAKSDPMVATPVEAASSATDTTHVVRHGRRRHESPSINISSSHSASYQRPLTHYSHCGSATSRLSQSSHTPASFSSRSHYQQPSRIDNHGTSLNHSPLKIEIAPGVQARLRGSRETFQAVENDFYRPVMCADCQKSDLCCILDASYLLCPKCRSVSPLEDGNPNIAQGGVGLGFTLDDLRVWQSQILNERKREQQQQSQNGRSRGRRQSMW